MVVAFTDHGVAYDHLGKFNEALADYNQAIELNPDTPDRDRIEGMIQQLKDDIAAGKMRANNACNATVSTWRNLLKGKSQWHNSIH